MRKCLQHQLYVGARYTQPGDRLYRSSSAFYLSLCRTKTLFLLLCVRHVSSSHKCSCNTAGLWVTAARFFVHTHTHTHCRSPLRREILCGAGSPITVLFWTEEASIPLLTTGGSAAGKNKSTTEEEGCERSYVVTSNPRWCG